MKLKEAREIAEICGLETDAEAINNIVLHACNLFLYTDLPGEIDELFEDAKAEGVRFSTSCGDAIPADADESLPCHFCSEMARLDRERKDGAD